MRYRIVVFLTLACLFVVYLLGQPRPAESENLEIEAYFCEEQGCSAAMASAISSASVFADCAFYRTNDAKVEAALQRKNEQIPVKIFMDEGAKEIDGIDTRKEHGTGLMHHKFCVLDNRTVLTGSWNPAAGTSDSNNLLVIRNAGLAQEYSQYFSSIWNGGRGYSLDKTYGNSTHWIDVRFCPEENCAGTLSKHLESAETEIDFLAYSFTNPEIVTTLIMKAHEGIKVRGIVDHDEENITESLVYQGAEIRNKTGKGLLHDKVFIIDKKIVSTGSMNPTRSGDERNYEDLLIIQNPELAKKYYDEFENIWDKSQ